MERMKIDPAEVRKPQAKHPKDLPPTPSEPLPVMTFEVDGAEVTCQRVNALTVRLFLQGCDPLNPWMHDAHCPNDNDEELARIQYQAVRLVRLARKHKAIPTPTEQSRAPRG